MKPAWPGCSLVLGGARSGKSAYAERLVEQSGLSPVYLATGRSLDTEMETRIFQHRERRGPAWMTVEEPIELVAALTRTAADDRAVLTDCLTLWVTNLMLEKRNVRAECDALVDCVSGLGGLLVFVSNEVGLGIVPDNAMAREFRDHAGYLHQNMASKSDEVTFIAAGLPMKLKG